MTVTLFGLTLHEFDVAATDLLLCVEAALFALLLGRRPTAQVRLRGLAVALFVCLSLSSLLGAAFHAFFPGKVSTFGGYALWMLTGISIALTASVVWYINAALSGNRRLEATLPRLVPLYFAFFIAVLFFVDYQFRTIILFYAPPVVVLAVIAVWRQLREPGLDWLCLILGTFLSFAAAAVQTLKIGLHPVYFNFNALYHLIQGVALAFLFLSFRLLLRRTSLHYFRRHS